MSVLIRAFLDIALLRSGPQQLPASPLLLAIATIGCIATSMLLWPFATRVETSFARMLADTLVQMTLDVGVLGIVLRSGRRDSRYLQALTALFGANAVMALVALVPLAVLHLLRSLTGDDGTFGLGLLLIVLLGWGLAVLANILHHALEVPIGIALVIAFFCTFTTLLVGNWLGVN